MLKDQEKRLMYNHRKYIEIQKLLELSNLSIIATEQMKVTNCYFAKIFQNKEITCLFEM